MIIRPATPDDVAALRDLSIATFTDTFGHLYDPADLATFISEAYSVEALGAILESDAHAVWLLEEDSESEEGAGTASSGSTDTRATGSEDEASTGTGTAPARGARSGTAAAGYVLAGPCGLPHADVQPEDGEIKRLYIRREHQGKGYGERLMTTAMKWLLRDGPRTLWLGVWSENSGAQRLYERFGFSKAGEYGFEVGGHVDHEFIFRRPKESL